MRSTVVALRDRKRQRLRELVNAVVVTGWELATLITEIVQSKMYLDWHFRSVRAWVLEDLEGVYLPPAVSRIVNTVSKVQGMPPDKRALYESRPFWNAVEALDAEDPQEAEELIQSSKTAFEIRGTIKARKESAAARAGETPPPQTDEKFVYLDIPAVPQSIAEKFGAACNLTRFQLEVPTPSMVTTLEHLLVNYLQNWERDIDPELLAITAEDGTVVEVTAADVAAGKVRCQMCKSWDRQTLVASPVIPKRNQCNGCHKQHEVPFEFVCSTPCYERINDSEETWREWADKWGYAELAAGH